MIDLKNRTSEMLTYQYSRDVSCGPVRPCVLDVKRRSHNPANGEVTLKEAKVALGGVLTLLPKGELKGLPDDLAKHPALARDIAARRVIVKKCAAPKAATKSLATPKKRRK